MKMVIDDGARLADALEAVTKDPSLKESFFTTPLALHSLQSLSSPLKYHKGKGKAKGFGVQPDGTQPPPAPHQQQRPTKGGKGKGKLNGQVLATKTPYDSATLLSSRRNMLCANMFSSLFSPTRPALVASPGESRFVASIAVRLLHAMLAGVLASSLYWVLLLVCWYRRGCFELCFLASTLAGTAESFVRPPSQKESDSSELRVRTA